ncbi:MAG: ABC transporter permease [Muribaculaceae bacterium]|nr:ABC transporter permease [Muribaculaceae bacterium]
MDKLVTRLLRKNTSKARIAGFILSNFIGLAIVLGGLQFFLDARTIWTSEDSFIRSDYLVVNKKVTSANTLGAAQSGFTEAETDELRSQPWVRRMAEFTSNDYRVLAGVRNGDRGMSTYMFFESIPDEFVDVPRSQWLYRPGDSEVPIILSKDYLTLYNFGFASSAGLPQLSEGLMSSIPLSLTLTSEDGTRTRRFTGRVAGFSNRLNTILVPRAFMEETNAALGSDHPSLPSRLIIDTSSPGDVAITRYLDSHGLEAAGDKSASSAAFMLRVVAGIVLAIGTLITILSLFILMLSMSLIMEKNRDKIHSLIMLGYDPVTTARPYCAVITAASLLAFALATAGVMTLRAFYMESLAGLGAVPSPLWITLCTGAAMTALIICLNIMSVRRRVRKCFNNC